MNSTRNGGWGRSTPTQGLRRRLPARHPTRHFRSGPVYAKHPEFAGENKVINLVTEGIREYTDPYIPVKKGDDFRYDGTPSVDSDGIARFASAPRAVSPPAAATAAPCTVWRSTHRSSAPKTAIPAEDGIILGNDGAVYKAGWDALVASGAASSTTAGASALPKSLRRGL
ncbi:hypothetical protein M8494_31325 [Serratia ureilytica]